MTPPTRRVLLPLGAGLAGALFLTSLYLGIVSLAESPAHALDLFWQDRLFVIPILLGFGAQVGLFTYLKQGLYLPVHTAPAGATTAAGGGVSAVAMVACCAHHVADVLPLVGLTAAATFLANWKIPFMIVGLLSNLIGIGFMLREIIKARRHALAHAGMAAMMEAAS
ncbi:MAG: hypothetical protein HY784_02750 [Chloroflexi bacterium]|nr:hypothetical protein [Chloroflexota bacterium]